MLILILERLYLGKMAFESTNLNGRNVFAATKVSAAGHVST